MRRRKVVITLLIALVFLAVAAAVVYGLCAFIVAFNKQNSAMLASQQAEAEETVNVPMPDTSSGKSYTPDLNGEVDEADNYLPGNTMGSGTVVASSTVPSNCTDKQSFKQFNSVFTNKVYGDVRGVFPPKGDEHYAPKMYNPIFGLYTTWSGNAPVTGRPREPGPILDLERESFFEVLRSNELVVVTCPPDDLVNPTGVCINPHETLYASSTYPEVHARVIILLSPGSLNTLGGSLFRASNNVAAGPRDKSTVVGFGASFPPEHLELTFEWCSKRLCEHLVKNGKWVSEAIEATKDDWYREVRFAHPELGREDELAVESLSYLGGDTFLWGFNLDNELR